MKLQVKKSILILLASAPLLFFQNCGKPESLNYGGSMDLSSEAGLQSASIQILQKNCTECHSATVTNGGVGDLTDVTSDISLGLIVPGSPDTSSIISQIDQGLMPAGRPALNASEVDVLKSWISGLNQGGTGGGSTTNPVDPSYSALAASVFSARCVSCHSGQTYKLNSYTEVLRTVVPGDASSSLLYQAITTGTTGGKMPQGGSLTTAQIQAIQEWINAGAANN